VALAHSLNRNVALAHSQIGISKAFLALAKFLPLFRFKKMTLIFFENQGHPFFGINFKFLQRRSHLLLRQINGWQLVLFYQVVEGWYVFVHYLFKFFGGK
jgi:hypothetical protein